MESLYIIPDRNNLDKSIEIAKKYNACFEYNDFFEPTILDNKQEIDRIIKLYLGIKDKNNNKDTLHGAFMDITVFSHDKKIREISIKRVMQSLEIATQLNCKAVIFHTNYLPNFLISSYYDKWVVENTMFWSGIIKQFPSIDIYIENMFDFNPKMISMLAQSMKDEKRFGVCLDCGHAFLSGTPISDWIDELSPFIRHLHFSDNEKVDDFHLQIGKGFINWLEVSNKIKQKNINSSVLIEIQDVEKQISSIEYLKENKIYPFV